MKKYEFSAIEKMGYRPYIKLMVDELNEAKITPRSYHIFLYNENAPDASFLGGIATSEKAIEYLKEIGLLNNGICPLCGKRPIDNKSSFTSGLYSNVTFSICMSCYKTGKQTSINPKNKEGCYIATYCYEDYNAPEVLLFRKFRDTFLIKYYIGRQMVRFYYLSSPIIIRIFGQNTHIKNFIKNKILDVFYRFLKEKKYEE